jgi:hypothetical protein
MSPAITRRSVVSQREAVNGRGYHYVAVDEGLHQLVKLRPVGGGAGDFLAEDLLASGVLELGDLAALSLGGGRDAHMAVNHVRIVHQKYASKKRNFVNGRPDDADILISAMSRAGFLVTRC